MKRLILLLFCCVCAFFSNAQLLLPDTIIEQPGYIFKKDGNWKSWYAEGLLLDSGFLKKGVPDGGWMTWYKNGTPRYIRNYSADKWLQFQNEKSRYHAKRISMPVTKLWHEDKTQASMYTTAVNSFCAKENCTRVNEPFPELNANNASGEHYHPPFENGLLHGQFINYFDDGTVKDSGNYKNGLPEGIWIKWTDDKQFYWKGYYQHGLKNKEWKLYDAGAKLLRIVSYREGKLLWRKDMKEGVELEEDTIIK